MKVPNQVIEYNRETDGRWIAEIPAVPGAMAYGATKEEAAAKARAIARAVTCHQPASSPKPSALGSETSQAS